MKTRKSKLLTISVIIVLALVAATGLIGAAMAAPGSGTEGKIQAAPMPALAEVTCTLVDTTRTCDIWALPGEITMPDGSLVPVWGFADNAAGPAQVPGPIIRANTGETLEIVLHNEVAGESISLGFPGMEMVPDLAGTTAGGTAAYSLALSEPGTFLYEAGLTGGGARQVAMGLFGTLVVGPSPVVFDQEIVLVFSEVDPAFNADPLNFPLNHFETEYWLINGQAYPDTGAIPVAAGSTVLVRYLNAGVEHLSIGLLGLDQQILAVDGEPLPFTRGAVTEPMAPGETKEALVVVPTSAETDTIYALYNTSLHQHNSNQRLSDGRTAFGGMLTFLQVTAGGTPGNTGPVASNVTVTPAKTNGIVDVTFSATLTDSDTVAAYEFFIDNVGTPGAGTAVTPAVSVDVAVVLSAADLALLDSGEHTLYILGQDAVGTWGSPGSAALYLDKAGPSITGISLVPNPTNGSTDVLLSATADDRPNGSSLVVAAEYTFNGVTLPMDLSATGTSLKAITATILAADLVGLAEGAHPVTIRAQDEWGNWSVVDGTIDLLLDITGPAVSAVSLTPNTLDFNQALPVTAVRLEATVTDATSTLSNAEAFIDTVGLPGDGFDLYASDGLFDESLETVYFNIPVSHFGTLADGVHTVYVIGLDKAGNWTAAGTEGSANITVIAAAPDITPPVVSNLLVVADGNNRITITAQADDAQSIIDNAIWYLAADPGTTFTLDAADGAFDSLSEAITTVRFRINQWPTGDHEIVVVAMDAAGNWSTPVSFVYTK